MRGARFMLLWVFLVFGVIKSRGVVVVFFFCDVAFTCFLPRALYFCISRRLLGAKGSFWGGLGCFYFWLLTCLFHALLIGVLVPARCANVASVCFPFFFKCETCLRSRP